MSTQFKNIQVEDALFVNGVNTKVRSDFELIKSGAELEAAFPPVLGVITLTKNVEYEGTIITDKQVDLNGFYLIGKNAFMDKHIYTNTGNAFIGANGGTMKLLTLVSATIGSSLFNMIDTIGDKSIVLRDLIIANTVDVGLLKGFNLLAIDVVNVVNCSNGIQYEDINNCFINNVLYDISNLGTLEKYVGTFGIISNLGGAYNVNTGVTGVDVSGVTSLDSGELLSSPFGGAGTYTLGNFSVEWTVNCTGIDLIGDDFSSTNLRFDNGTTNLALTQNVWDYFDMSTAILDANTTHRFEQLVGFPDTLVYKGKHDVVKTVIATLDLRRIGAGTNIYQMRVIAGGGVISNLTKQFGIGGVGASVTIAVQYKFKTNDLFWVEIRNITDNDDVRLLSASIIVK